jgi:CHRD domain-containing protein
MKRYFVYALALFGGAACSQDSSTARGPIAPSASSTAPISQAAEVPVNYRAHLSGREVVPAIETLAEGQAIFQLSPDGTGLSYHVNASNIENVTGVHLHLGPVGLRGPLVFFLGLSTGPGRTDGVLATGTITSANLLGPLRGMPLSDLMSQIEAGNVYVDVPTNDGIFPPNTGPGDFNGGELRGQIR